MTNVCKTLGLSVGVLLVSMFVVGCGGDTKVASIAVGEMQEYRDPMFGYHFQYPKEWAASGEAGRPRVYFPPEARERFLDPLGQYPDGVMIAVDVHKTSDAGQQKASLIAELTTSGRVVGQETPVSVGGQAGFKVPYTASFSTKVKEIGHHIYVPLDTVLYDLSFAGFGSLYASHEAVFDSVLKSFAFPRAVEPGLDATLPSETYTSYDAKLFTFQYPENFNFVNIPRGTNELTLGLRGVRQDCSILFHVFGAKALTLEKVFEQNKGNYAGASTGKATISGLPAMTLTYTPTREVERRFYFVVKDDKVYRVTLDWFRPQRAVYLAAYDKVISSIKLK
jgi:hypothetical protein